MDHRHWLQGAVGEYVRPMSQLLLHAYQKVFCAPKMLMNIKTEPHSISHVKPSTLPSAASPSFFFFCRPFFFCSCLVALLAVDFVFFSLGAFGVLMPFQERNGILVTFGYLAL